MNISYKKANNKTSDEIDRKIQSATPKSKSLKYVI